MNRRGTLVVVPIVLALGAIGTAFAYAADGWTVAGNRARITGKIATMPRGVKPSVAKQDGTAVVSWSAQEIAPGTRMDGYVVTAHSLDVTPRPDVAHTVTAHGAVSESVTFAATEVTGGKWYWTITPKLASWTGTESARSAALGFPVKPVSPAAAVLAATPEAVTETTSPSATPAETHPVEPGPPAEVSPPAEPAPEATGATPAESTTPGTSAAPGVGPTTEAPPATEDQSAGTTGS